MMASDADLIRQDLLKHARELLESHAVNTLNRLNIHLWQRNAKHTTPLPQSELERLVVEAWKKRPKETGGSNGHANGHTNGNGNENGQSMGTADPGRLEISFQPGELSKEALEATGQALSASEEATQPKAADVPSDLVAVATDDLKGAKPDAGKLARDERIDELARMEAGDYGVTRKEAAKTLGMSVAALDAAVRARRKARREEAKSKRQQEQHERTERKKAQQERRQEQAAAGVEPDLGANWREVLAEDGVLRVKDDGQYAGNELAVTAALRSAPELKGILRYNLFSLKAELTRAPPWHRAEPERDWEDKDDTALSVWLQSMSIDVHRSVTASVELVASDNAYHPVRDYLNALKWDGTHRLALWLQTYLGCAGDLEYLQAVGMRWMISAVARIMRPGCKVDHTLVLEGEQGLRKSSAIRVLAGGPQWFLDQLSDLSTKEAMVELAGRWIVEIAELDAICRTRHITTVKSFLTKQEDVYRSPYGRRTAPFPRQCVFFGTTNKDDYLEDETGNRRFWPVRCGRIDLEALERDRDQLWAEAVKMYREGEQWHLTDRETKLAVVEQEDRVQLGEIDAKVSEYLDALPVTVSGEGGMQSERLITMRDVLQAVFHLDHEAPEYAEKVLKLQTPVGKAIRKAGWVKAGRTGRAEKRNTTYKRNSAAATLVRQKSK